MQRRTIRGRYYLDRVLGKGGFGHVYLAFDQQEQRWCAIKEIRIESSDDRDFVMNEVVTLGNCDHFEFIPTIYDAFFEGGSYPEMGYVVMEYIEGTALNQIGDWTAPQVAHFLDQMLSNLAQLHAHGFVHRDIKPENILWTHQSRYALVDFGIAKMGTETRSIVRPVLTPQFAAPEQINGQGTDQRSDLYSLGATAFFLLTGKYIAPMATRQRTLMLDSLRKERPDAPPALVNTLRRLLQLDPDERPSTAQAARAMLQPSPRRRNTRWIAALMVIAVLGACSYGALANRTLLAGVVAWLQPGEQDIDPSPTVARSPFPADQLDQVLAGVEGTWGVLVYDLPNQQQVYAQNENEMFPAASLAKLPIVLTVYRQAEAGQLNLDEEVALEEADKGAGGSGSLQSEPVGSTYTLRELCRRMLINSDNVAGNMVLRRIGVSAVNQAMDQLGATQTQVQRRFGDLALRDQGFDNLTTPADTAMLLRALATGEVLNQEHRDEILDAMRQTTDASKLPATLPDGTQIAHKTGTLPSGDGGEGVEHDVGIVSTDQGQYIIVAMSKDLADNAAARSAIGEVSQLVYAWFTGSGE